MAVESVAYARAGLMGNPSDGYFGKTISISASYTDGFGTAETGTPGLL